jgi:hypothetical protein
LINHYYLLDLPKSQAKLVQTAVRGQAIEEMEAIAKKVMLKTSLLSGQE